MEGQTGGSAADGLFDYDLDFEDIIRDRNESGSNAAAATGQQPPPGVNHANQQKVDDTNLGLDEEIQVTKKRQPVPKLDEEKLLSQKGIPRLRKKARKLNLHGKGREYEDTAKLLNFFQLWLDDLHPRVKFADGLAIIEKLGHSKRLITMRKEWINEATRQRQGYSDTPREESSFNFTQNEPSNATGNNTFGLDMRDSTAMEQDNDLFVDEGNNGNLSSNVLLPTNEHEEDDDLDALLAEPSMQDLSINNTHMPRNEDTDMPLAERNTNSAPPHQQSSTRADEPPEDDLDALLAEEDEILSSLKNKGNQQQQPAPDDFEDDWEAMREFGM